MKMKLFDNTDLSKEEIDSVNMSNEDIIIADLEFELSQEETNDMLAMFTNTNLELSKLQAAITVAKEAIDENTVNKSNVIALQMAIESCKDEIGIDTVDVTFSSEDITDPVEKLTTLSTEAANIITKAVATLAKMSARTSNTLLKYIGKFDTFLDGMFINLDKLKNELTASKSLADNYKEKYISDKTFWQFRGFSVAGALGLNDNGDPIKGIKNILDVYNDAGMISKFTDSIVDMMTNDGAPKPLYGNSSAIKTLESNFGKKIKNFFCKSGDDDRLVIGANYTNVFILERCKMLHIKSKLNGWTYTVNALPIPASDIFGTPKQIPTPSYDGMLGLIDEAIKVVGNRKKVVADIHKILKVNGESIKKIDDNVSWESVGIYGIMPMILLVLAKTYADVPNSVGSIAKIYLKEIKDNAKK